MLVAVVYNVNWSLTRCLPVATSGALKSLPATANVLALNQEVQAVYPIA